ncbi:hypothetical protein TMO_a0210 (plasmid) [Tistrella mobilis KA081020-065]|uniref:Uncharacterized protein n=1 Tax=Tistrella mobilis (strain KA081020-065) TaxID=1110502 RepID=I3TS75_TISMK|nr:hypothetical protein TMO_a0210 [Tistrella mobilis KA081020-065]
MSRESRGDGADPYGLGLGFNPRTRKGATVVHGVPSGSRSFNPRTRKGATAPFDGIKSDAVFQSTHPQGCDVRRSA